MAGIKVHGDAAVLTSEVKLEVIQELQKFKPEMLKLVDTDTGVEIFAIGIGPVGNVGKYGVIFTGKNDAGKATVTMSIPTGLSNAEKKDHVKNTFGYALLNLNTLEATIAKAKEELDAEFAAMNHGISVID